MIAALSRTEVDALLREHVVGRVGCHAGGLAYVVPVIDAYGGDSRYVASAGGQKIRMMRQNPGVCFEVDECEAGSWRSAIVQGVYEEFRGAGAEHAIELLAARCGRAGGSRRHGSHGSSTVCFRIRIREATGRTARG